MLITLFTFCLSQLKREPWVCLSFPPPPLIHRKMQLKVIISILLNPCWIKVFEGLNQDKNAKLLSCIYDCSWEGCQVGKSILKIADGELLYFQICMSQTEEEVCVVFSVSQPSHTQSLLLAPALSWRPAWYQEGRGAENWPLVIGTESAAEPTSQQQQNGKKGAFLPRRGARSHQRSACLCLQRVAVTFGVLLLGLVGWFQGLSSATQGRTWFIGFTLTLILWLVGTPEVQKAWLPELADKMEHVSSWPSPM